VQPLSLVAAVILSNSAFTAAASTLAEPVWNRPKESMTAFCGMIGVGRSVTRNGANLAFRVKTTVLASGAATEATFVWMSEQKLGMKVQFFDAARSNVNLTSADVKSVPSCHLMPFLILTVQVRPSSLTCGRSVAMSGMTASLLLTRYRPV